MKNIQDAVKEAISHNSDADEIELGRPLSYYLDPEDLEDMIEDLEAYLDLDNIPYDVVCNLTGLALANYLYDMKHRG